ncbi:MAG TPA: YkgJ family cysteine cluster protein, partial [candidate division Zixibacteria bacterium]|nr:YkgJ family cysteine cluster protein [candidate division Zixibacteria bacterium]
DIYKYVRNGNIWLDPDTGQQIELCPWLKKLSNKNAYICGIYNDRPEDCRAYPSTLDEMILDECEMIETHDLLNQQQAKKTLETLMAVDRYPNL